MSKVEKFGKYILLEKLAVGGMAEVYLAKSNGANGVHKFVAIKRILPQYTNNPEFISMFKEEAKVAINLSHSNIVSIYDFGIENDQFYLVMEFVEGQNLRQIINEMKKSNKSFNIDQAVYIVKEAAAGLNHAHRCVDAQSGKPLNITHRDMSPQNIMISFEGESKVIDFGIAKSTSETEATKAGTLKGKFSYMSPEQSEGFSIDPRTDVFALGIILWELLANDRLFTGSNEGAILRKVRECQIPAIRKINPLVPIELERIVMKALAKDKNVRYQTAANLHKDLNLFLNTQYPDFSTHDFSQFICSCFKSSYNERKEKLIAFSQLELPAEAPSVSRENVQNIVSTNIKTETIVNGLKIKDTLVDDLEIAGIKINKDSRSQLQGLGSISVQKRNNSHGSSIHTRSSTQIKNGHTQYGQKTTSGFVKNFEQQIIILAVLFFAGIFGYQTYFNQQAVEKTPVAKKIQKQGQIDLAATASTRVSISSQPSGAKIYIDNQPTEQITPSVTSVTSNKNVTITLYLDGYYKYQKTQSFNTASSLSAQLIPMPPMGYVDIEVLNGGENPVIEINGIRVNEKPPLLQYAIPANVITQISVRNPFTNLSTKQSIIVTTANKPDRPKKIQLVLGSQK